MKTTADYLDELKEHFNARSDTATGRALGWSKSATNEYRHLQSAFDNYACLTVAKALQIPLIQVIADMELQRTTDPDRRAEWREIATNHPRYRDRDEPIYPLLTSLPK